MDTLNTCGWKPYLERKSRGFDTCGRFDPRHATRFPPIRKCIELEGKTQMFVRGLGTCFLHILSVVGVCARGFWKMNPPHRFDQIGEAFVKTYYECFDSDRSKLANFYVSVFSVAFFIALLYKT